MKMTNPKTGATLNIIEHIILKNFWEYYVVDNKGNDDDIKLCLVMGFETELGDVSMNEIKPYIISRTKNFDDVAPAPNWKWEK